MTDRVGADCSQKWPQDWTAFDQISAPQQSTSRIMSSKSKRASNSSDNPSEDRLSNGSCEAEALLALRCSGDREHFTAEDEHLTLSNDGMSEFPDSDFPLPEVCVSTNRDSVEDDMDYEVQQAYKIFTSFLSDKHKGITGSFLHPIGRHETQHGDGVHQGRVQSQLRQSMCLKRIEEKFISQEYETITEFVADVRLMLENCYRYYGVDHWISKQAQKLETMMEQKLTLLSRTLREKTTLAMTSKGRFAAEEERGSGGTSTRKRQASRYFATATVGGHESVMVQALRLEEQQRAKEEKRQRELEKKEAEEMSAKEVEDWERSLLSQASPHTVDTVWELPAVGHFLCLAQTALNLPEIVFFELERCLLMPRCSLLLSKIMSSLLSPPQRRATLHRRPALPYRRWESELRQRILGWYRAIGASRDQPRRAEQLGLCHQFFSILGEVSPLEEKPFHLLPFYQRVWLLKGLCDHVYETQRDVQDAVLAQPIHECRESILGYDGKENAYIHFPHFCGADLRIYCQSPSTPPAFPFPSVLVKRVETEAGTEGEESDVIKSEEDRNDEASINSEECDFVKTTTETLIKKEEGNSQEDKHRFQLWSPSELQSSNGHSCDNSKFGAEQNANSLVVTKSKLFGECDVKMKDEISVVGQQSKQERVFSLASERIIKSETEDPCLSVGEHSYTGRSPASSASLGSPAQLGVNLEEVSPSQGHQMSPCLECCKNTASDAKSAGDIYCCSMSRLATPLSSERTQNFSDERVNEKSWTNKKKRKKKWAGEQLVGVKWERGHLLLHEETRLSQTEAADSSAQKSATTIKRKEKKRKLKTEKKAESLKKAKEEAAPPFPSFKLVCSSLDELRELISKIEDELDELESMKKRLGRWYYKKEAVKELHSTLIRLLNELLPWEPKLVKACQRNRLRLKKEFDDFKKHPEYNSFVREECVSSSSSSDYDCDERGLEKDYCLELENDQEHVVPRGLWIGANTREFVAKSAAEETCAPANHPKHPLTIKEKGVCTTTAESRRELGMEPIQIHQSKDSAWTQGLPAHLSLSPKCPILNLTGGLPKSYTPIPTLLAKSVGNKVTLMKRPTDLSSSVDGQRKRCLVSTSTVANPKIVKAQRFPSVYQQSLEQMTAQSSQQTQVREQLSTKAAALPKTPQAKISQSERKSPVQVVYKAPEGFGHLVSKDKSNPVKMSVNSVVDQKTAEKVMQQVVFLPSNLLVKQTETRKNILNPKQSKGIPVTVSTVASPVCISTNVPGFSIPESNVTVQHVDTLKDAKPGKYPGTFFPLPLQKGTLNTVGYNETQVCNVQTTTPKDSVPTTSPVTTVPKAVSADTVKLAEPKQELKTMCIRGSQSILVTTRGGNTGIVKVQTSSDQNALGLFPTSPVITISPQLKAFLVSKALPTFSASAISQTSASSASTVTSISTAQKNSPNLTNSTLATVTSRIPLTGQDSQTTSANVALSQCPKISNCLMSETKISKLVPTSTSASSFPASSFINSAPSLSNSGVSQVLTQEFIKKAGAKRPSADENSQATKRFLVTPSSSMTSNEATSKNTPSSPKSFSSSKVMLISQPSVSSSATFKGNLPKQVMLTGSGQSTISSVSSQTLTTKSSTNASSSSEASPKASNMTMPSSIAFSLLGKTTSIGQTIGALSLSSSTTTPVSELGTSFSTAAITTGLVSFTTSATRCSSQLGPCSSLSTSSPLQGVAAISGISQVSCTSSTGPGLLRGNLKQNDPGILTSTSPKSSPVRVTTPAGGPAQTWTSVLHPKPLFFKSTLHEEHIALPPSSQLARNKTQATLSFAPSTCTSLTTSTTGTVQQRIIINTSTHLTAGTQIFLNNARFVVPPQGLGPGSHVLIISIPEPQVPTVTHTITGPSVALKGQSPTNFTPLAPVLPQTSAKLPVVPAVSSLVACTPALLPSAPHVTPFRLGASSLGSTLVTSKSHAVSALPRFPSVHAGNFGSPPVCTSTLASSPPRLGSVPAVISPVITSAPALGSSLATIGIPASTITQTTSSSTIAPISTPLPKLSGALSSLPVFPSLSVDAFSSPVIPVSSPLCSVSAPTVTGTPSLPGQEMAGLMNLGPTVQPEQTGVRFAAPSTVHPQSIVQTGLGNSLIKNHLTVLQPVLSGTMTQILPPMSVPTIVNAMTRMKPLPVATVPPVGNTVSTFEMAPANMAAPASTAVIVSPGQPVTSMASRNAIQQPVILANKALIKDSLQISALGTYTSVPSKLLVSPDGAVLSTVQCRVSPTNLNAFPKPLDALVVSSNSSSGALQTHDSSLQPLQADTSETTEQH